MIKTFLYDSLDILGEDFCFLKIWQVYINLVNLSEFAPSIHIYYTLQYILYLPCQLPSIYNYFWKLIRINLINFNFFLMLENRSAI